MEPLYLLAEELEYELMLRGVYNVSNARARTVALRDLLAKEKIGLALAPTSSKTLFSSSEELSKCSKIYADILAKVDDSQVGRTGQLQCMSRLLHLKSRIVRILPASPQETSQMKDLIGGTKNIIKYLTPQLNDDTSSSRTDRNKSVPQGPIPTPNPRRFSLPEKQGIRRSSSPVSVPVNIVSQNSRIPSALGSGIDTRGAQAQTELESGYEPQSLHREEEVNRISVRHSIRSLTSGQERQKTPPIFGERQRNNDIAQDDLIFNDQQPSSFALRTSELNPEAIAFRPSFRSLSDRFAALQVHSPDKTVVIEDCFSDEEVEAPNTLVNPNRVNTNSLPLQSQSRRNPQILPKTRPNEQTNSHQFSRPLANLQTESYHLLLPNKQPQSKSKPELYQFPLSYKQPKSKAQPESYQFPLPNNQPQSKSQPDPSQFSWSHKIPQQNSKPVPSPERQPLPHLPPRQYSLAGYDRSESPPQRAFAEQVDSHRRRYGDNLYVPRNTQANVNYSESPPRPAFAEQVDSHRGRYGNDPYVPRNTQTDHNFADEPNRFGHDNNQHQAGYSSERYRKTVPVHQWRISFSGEGRGLHLYDFLSQVEMYRSSERLSSRDLLDSAVHLLTGRALKWFGLTRRSYFSWEQLVEAMKREFLPPSYDYSLLAEITNRMQKSTESCAEYMTHMQSLFDCLPMDLAEGHKIFIVQKNLLPKYALGVAPIPIISLSHLADVCRRIDGAYNRQSQIQLPFQQTPQFGHKQFSSRSRESYGLDEYNKEGSGDEQEVFEMRRHGTARKAGASAGIGKTTGSTPKVSCWNCDNPDHVYQDCREEKRNKFCYKCGKKGFISWDCPKCKGNAQQSPKEGEPDSATQKPL